MNKVLMIVSTCIATLLGAYLGMWVINILFNEDNSIFTSSSPYITALIVSSVIIFRRIREDKKDSY